MSFLDALLDANLAESFGSSATRDAVARGGKPFRPQRAGSGTPAKFDPAKHKRGQRGTSSGGKFISAGSSGRDVRSVQRRVGAKQDGQFGEQTKRAVMSFQKRHGLKVDGIVGRQTATAMGGQFRKARATKPGSLRSSDLGRLKKIRVATRRPTPRTGGGVRV